MVYFGQPFQNSLIRGDWLAQPNKGPYHKDTHVDGSFAMENVRGHHGTVLSEGPGAKSRISVLLGTGHKL